MKKIITIILLTGLLILPISVFAAPAPDCATYCSDPSAWDPPTGQTCVCNPLDYETLEELVEAITNFLFYVSLALVPLLVLIGAFYILTAGGDPKRVVTGQKVILYTVIGLAVILFTRGIIAIIRYALGQPSS